MDPDKFPGVAFAALVVIRNHAVYKKTGTVRKRVELSVIHQNAAAGENENDKKGFQILSSGDMTFFETQIASFLHIKEGRTGEAAGRLNKTLRACHIGIGKFIKIVLHRFLLFLKE